MVGPLLLEGLLVVVWPSITWPLMDPTDSFPFVWRFTTGSTPVNLGVTSAAVTLLYTAHAWSIYRIARGLQDWALVRFFARNTLFIFIAHMPVYYAIQPLLVSRIGKPTSVVVLFFVCFVGLALVSEVLRRVMRPDRAAGPGIGIGMAQGREHAPDRVTRQEFGVMSDRLVTTCHWRIPESLKQASGATKGVGC